MSGTKNDILVRSKQMLMISAGKAREEGGSLKTFTKLDTEL